MARDDELPLLIIACLMVAIAWQTWKRRRDIAYKPLRFSMQWMLIGVTFFCVTTWIVVTLVRYDLFDPHGIAALVVVGATIGAAIGLPFRRPITGAIVGAVLSGIGIGLLILWIMSNLADCCG